MCARIQAIECHVQTELAEVMVLISCNYLLWNRLGGEQRPQEQARIHTHIFPHVIFLICDDIQKTNV